MQAVYIFLVPPDLTSSFTAVFAVSCSFYIFGICCTKISRDIGLWYEINFDNQQTRQRIMNDVNQQMLRQQYIQTSNGVYVGQPTYFYNSRSHGGGHNNNLTKINDVNNKHLLQAMMSHDHSDSR